MPSVRYSNKALDDLRKIGNFTLDRWGLVQAEKYVNALREGCILIAELPHVGRHYNPSNPSRYRFELHSHVVLYSIREGGITVQRFLQKNRLLPRG